MGVGEVDSDGVVLPSVTHNKTRPKTRPKTPRQNDPPSPQNNLPNKTTLLRNPQSLPRPKTPQLSTLSTTINTSGLISYLSLLLPCPPR